MTSNKKIEVRISPKEIVAEPLRGNEQLVIGVLLCDRPVLQRWFEALQALKSSVPFGVVLVNNPGVNKMVEICQGRTLIVNQAIKAKARYVFFLDDDVIVPPDILDKLLGALQKNPKAKIVGGVYPQLGWKNDNIAAAWDEHEKHLQTISVGQVVACGGVGSGCMLLDLTVLPKISKPWFSFENRGLNDLWRGDDVLLCNKVRAAGYQVLLHGGVICSHLDARVAGSDFKGKNPYELRHFNGRYVDAAGNVLLRSQVAH